MTRSFLVSRPIGRESGVGFLDQSQSTVKQNQYNPRLLSTLSCSPVYKRKVRKTLKIEKKTKEKLRFNRLTGVLNICRTVALVTGCVLEAFNGFNLLLFIFYKGIRMQTGRDK